MIGTCFECGAHGAMHAHHVVPRSAGGRNTVPLCERCHGLVHGRSLRISSLTASAMQHMRAQGRRVGSVPHGYADDGAGRLVPVEAEQEVLRLVAELRARGYSLREISAALAERGAFNRAGRPFNAKSVRAMVRAERT